MDAQLDRDLPFKKGDIVSLPQLDEHVFELVKLAKTYNKIPIAGIVSERIDDSRHRILGGRWNYLKGGIPGIHGETAAIQNAGRLTVEKPGFQTVVGGYRNPNLVITSSLFPCPFCQCTMALHLGVKTIRMLDNQNWNADMEAYKRAGISPSIQPHPGIMRLFGEWVNDPANAEIWNRDIGIFKKKTKQPVDIEGLRASGQLKNLVKQACDLAEKARQNCEAPIGALILDSEGLPIGQGYSRIIETHDPAMVAGMAAWRDSHARDQWKDKTLLLTAGATWIDYSMFHVFNFGQLIVLSDAIFPGQTEKVRSLGKKVEILLPNGAPATDEMGEMILMNNQKLSGWQRSTALERVREFYGADYTPLLVSLNTGFKFS